MNKYLQILTCHRWRSKLSDQELLQLKNITLDYYKLNEINLEYLDNWSIWLDIKIIFKTIFRSNY